MILKNSQKNDLAEIIEEAWFKISEFNIKDIKSKKLWIKKLATTITHINKWYYFSFDTGVNINRLAWWKNVSFFSPWEDKLEDSNFCWTYRAQILTFKAWIKRVQYEIETPNKWNEYKTKIEDLNLYWNLSNESFNSTEIEDLQNKIWDISKSIHRLEMLTIEESKFIRDKLENHSMQLPKMGKFDWFSQLLGIYINFMLAVSLNPWAADALFNILKTTFKRLILN